MCDIPEIQNTDIEKTNQVRLQLNSIGDMFKSIEWGRMLNYKNDRLDQILEECDRLKYFIEQCKD